MQGQGLNGPRHAFGTPQRMFRMTCSEKRHGCGPTGNAQTDQYAANELGRELLDNSCYVFSMMIRTAQSSN